MIGAVLTDLGPRVTHADLTRTVDRTLSVAAGHTTGESVAEDHGDVVQIRVAADGRLGWAGGHTAAISSVAEAALRSARIGAAAPFFPPAPSALPAVTTWSPAAMALDESALLDLARRLRDRLTRADWEVEVWAERSSGAVEVGNTRGVLASYPVTMTGLGVEVRSVRSGAPRCRIHRSGVAPPSPVDLEDLVTEVESRFQPPSLELEAIPASVRVWFAPRAARALLAPVLTRLVGEAWRAPWPPLDRRLTLLDDPLADGRPGSRPLCDDGVPSRPIVLIQSGRPRQRLLDLVTASRHGLPATGHGWRRGFAGARIGFTNVVVENGTVPRTALAEAVGDGLMIADWELGPAPNPIGGGFRSAAPWAYRIAAGEVVGRVDGIWLSGDAFELLDRVVAVGADAEWLGAARIPSLVIDGVGAVVR